MKNSAIPILTPPFSHFPQQKTPQRPSIRTPPFLAFALFTPRSLPLHRTFHAFPPSSIHPQSPSIRAQLFRLPTFTPLVFRVLRAFPWQKTPIGGPIAKKMPPFGRKRRWGASFDRECGGRSTISEKALSRQEGKPQVRESSIANCPKTLKIRAPQRGPLAAFSAK